MDTLLLEDGSQLLLEDGGLLLLELQSAVVDPDPEPYQRRYALNAQTKHHLDARGTYALDARRKYRRF